MLPPTIEKMQIQKHIKNQLSLDHPYAKLNRYSLLIEGDDKIPNKDETIKRRQLMYSKYNEKLSKMNQNKNTQQINS